MQQDKESTWANPQFFYTPTKNTEKEVMDILPLQISSKKINHQGINLFKIVKECTMNYYTEEEGIHDQNLLYNFFIKQKI